MFITKDRIFQIAICFTTSVNMEKEGNTELVVGQPGNALNPSTNPQQHAEWCHVIENRYVESQKRNLILPKNL